MIASPWSMLIGFMIGMSIVSDERIQDLQLYHPFYPAIACGILLVFTFFWPAALVASLVLAVMIGD